MQPGCCPPARQLVRAITHAGPYSVKKRYYINEKQRSYIKKKTGVTCAIRARYGDLRGLAMSGPADRLQEAYELAMKVMGNPDAYPPPNDELADS